MNEVTRWRFVDIPRPTLKTTTYKWMFAGCGFACGSVWTVMLLRLMSHNKAYIVIYSITAAIFVWQGIYLSREGKRLRREVEMLRERFLQEIGPELTEDERGEASQS